MSTVPTAAGGYRRATRDLREPMVGGVAAGLAEHLVLPVLWVRLGFVVSAALGGLGLALYAAFWVLLPAGTPFEQSAPGLESASRGGRRPVVRRRLTDVGPMIVLGALGLAAVFSLQAVFGRGVVFWPVAIALVGVVPPGDGRRAV